MNNKEILQNISIPVDAYTLILLEHTAAKMLEFVDSGMVHMKTKDIVDLTESIANAEKHRKDIIGKLSKS